jgi:shikimate dehydrogenase
MHERAAEALGYSCHYQLIEIADRRDLLTVLEGVRRLGFAGVNVTYPYKEAVVALLDDLAPSAAAIGAVNTIIVKDNRLIGHNTDITGFARAIAPALPRCRNAVAVIGAGGVGKAIAFALSKLNVAEIRIFDSEQAQIEKLATLLKTPKLFIASSVEDAIYGANGIVNATPVGMLPNTETPVQPTLLNERLWVADVIYLPLITPLLAAARARGARIMTGRELAIYQAADAFELITGSQPSLEIMREAFDSVMAERNVSSHIA